MENKYYVWEFSVVTSILSGLLFLFLLHTVLSPERVGVFYLNCKSLVKSGQIERSSVLSYV